MKVSKLVVGLIISSVFALTACGNRSAEEKIKEQVQESVHSLTSEERPLAEINAKAYFEKEFPVQKGEDLTNVRGRFLECRPSDSNFNGMVTCKGLVPQIKGGFAEVTRYCGYRKELVGCSDVDNVKVR